MPNYYPSRWSDYSARWLETRSEREAREVREAAQRKADRAREYVACLHYSGDHTWCDRSRCEHTEAV